MAASDYSGWAKYLHDPLVLAGFAVLIFSVAAIQLSKKPLKQQKGLLLLFIIVLIIIVLSFVLAFKTPKSETDVPKNNVEQKSTGDKSPNVVTSGDVNMSYGDKSETGKR